MKKESVALRILIVGCLIVLLLIPLWMIQFVIAERQAYRNEAVKDISKSWAGPQTASGPVLTVVTSRDQINKNGVITRVKKKNSYLPENLYIEAEVFPEKRYRGIYSAILYRTDLSMRGNFDNAKIREILGQKDVEEIYLSFGIDDPRGIGQKIELKLNGTAQTINPGLKDKGVFSGGFHSNADIKKFSGGAAFELNLGLRGVDNLQFIPLGKNTMVKVNSSWRSPSFIGNFLPVKRNINEKGFSAYWSINHFNREFPQEWDSQIFDISKDKFGVKFFIPADEYQQSMRSSKYGLLIIILTFVSFFLVEIFSGKAIHPVQYLLVGLALIIFYSLLLALSEYIPFQYSYLLAGILVIGLITLYSKSLYQSKNIVVSVSGTLTAFYGFVYVLIRLQDYSLLLGNIALFLILAAVMFFTRKINWFDVLRGKSS